MNKRFRDEQWKVGDYVGTTSEIMHKFSSGVRDRKSLYNRIFTSARSGTIAPGDDISFVVYNKRRVRSDQVLITIEGRKTTLTEYIYSIKNTKPRNEITSIRRKLINAWDKGKILPYDDIKDIIRQMEDRKKPNRKQAAKEFLRNEDVKGWGNFIEMPGCYDRSTDY